MKFTEEDRQAMDSAAADAEKELDNIDESILVPVAEWIKKWYLVAGYKRLGRILLQHASKEDSP